jgi:hypothetical protein
MLILKIILAIVSWGFFIYVIFNVPYPDSLPAANLSQLLAFFIPLFLSLILTINFIFKNMPSSIILSFGILLLLILKSLGALNLISIILTVLAVALLISYFQPNLTYPTFMPKIKHLRRKR